MFKSIARLLVFFMIFQAVPEVAQAATGSVTAMVNKALAPNNVVHSTKELYPKDWVATVLITASLMEQAQQAAQQQAQPSADPAVPAATEASPPQRAFPWFPDIFHWKHPGAAQMIPFELIPGFGQGNEEKDMEIIQGVILGEQGYEVPTRLFWAYISASLYNGKTPDPYFVEDLKSVVTRREFFRTKLSKNTTFVARMGTGFKDSSGIPRIKLVGIPRIDFDQEISGYVFATVVPRESLYEGLPLSLVISETCFNGMFQEGVPVEAVIPKDTKVDLAPRPQTAKQVVKKEWRNYRGKKIDAPSRDDVQVRFEATPLTGGDKVVAEAYDNKQAELELEVGRQYTIKEVVDSMDWRADREQVTVRVGEKNDPIKVVNNEVRQAEETNAFVSAIPGPPGRDGEDGRDGKGFNKKWLIPIVAGIVAAAFLPMASRGKDTVVVEPVKGGNGSPNNAGGAP